MGEEKGTEKISEIINAKNVSKLHTQNYIFKKLREYLKESIFLKIYTRNIMFRWQGKKRQREHPKNNQSGGGWGNLTHRGPSIRITWDLFLETI